MHTLAALSAAVPAGVQGQAAINHCAVNYLEYCHGHCVIAVNQSAAAVCPPLAGGVGSPIADPSTSTLCLPQHQG